MTPTVYVAVGLLSLFALLSVALIVSIWCRHRRRAALPLIGTAFALTVWSTAYAVELVLPGYDIKLLCTKIVYLGVVAGPLAWSLFAACYTGQDGWLNRRTLAGLLVVPLLTTALVWTNELHHLMWRTVELHANQLTLDMRYGLWFFVHVAYSYGMLLFGSWLLIRALANARHVQRIQTIALLFGVAAPWLGNILHLLKIPPIAPFDPTPFAYGLSIVIFAWSFARLHLLHIVPVAYDMVVEGMEEGLVVLDEQDNVATLNPTAARMLGVSAEPGRPATQVLRALPRLVAHLASDSGATLEERYERDGAVRCYEVRLQPLLHQGKRARGRLITLRDITRRRAAEDQQNFLFSELRASEARYRAASEAAEAATRAKSEFLANMSHELRTPLGGVIGVAEALLHTRLGSQQRELIDILQSSSNALLDLINDVLDFSKIESGKLELEHAPVDLHACVEDVIDLVALHAAARQLDLTYRIDPALPQAIMGDAIRLRQILMNLLNNAIKFTDRGSVQLTVRPYAPDPRSGTPMIAFAISDTGIGISPEHQAQLFQSFSQGDSSTTRRYGGTGLGLAISKRLCELMGGTIEVESALGRGSVFRFTIQASAAGDAPAARRGSPAALARRRVLLVDAPSASRAALIAQLEHWGVRLHVATMRDELAALVRAGGPFDAIIAGADQYHCAGVAGLWQDLADQRVRPPGLLLIAALGQPATAVRHGWAGQVIVLTRPLKWSPLLHALERLFGIDATAREPDPPDPAPLAPAPIDPGLRILLVEDDQINRMMILHTLQRLGCQADTASNGREALALVGDRHYDIALIDVQMPEVDGLEVARRLSRPGAQHRRPYLIAVTAAAIGGARERCLEAGFDAYVTKPVREQVLAEAIQRGCAHLSGLALPATPPPDGSPQHSAAERLEAALLRHFQRDARFYTRVVPLYTADSQQMVAGLQQAVRQRDRAGVRSIAHKLKSSSAWVGATGFAELCELLETSADGAPAATLARLADQVVDEHPRVLRALEAGLQALREQALHQLEVRS